MATVKIPPVLRPSVGGEKEVQAAGDDVGAVLSSLAEQHPDTQSQLFSGEGQLNRYVNVYLNDEDVRVLDGLETSVSESDTLVILPAMAGGARLAEQFLRSARGEDREVAVAQRLRGLRERRDGDPGERAADADALRARLEQLARRRARGGRAR